ncbi:sulfate ABC transporter substrate-binding protein [Commensalibacter papalotli (ex Botero et al. 2024)]|uniref:Periplasmic component (Sbp) (PDB:5UM2) n=1 Tax=Commensalibacter papalotli (ex Botero et al. 2024) TaxID=2972766 RepID=A0ABM9HSD2_9PROT|nr:sulfate ABC transporter substrate-binding protein [Commensalibacter papalotli (ex Botero et al. 2024)]CAI3951957.1 ABC-type sulfate transport system [Commensalibacter papalotli (ex Botero et al. 2024)]CAI3955915.1 ABC-type sulfate transport system [Commensalibacter papalotli (ex Botero et al. 2024)]
MKPYQPKIWKILAAILLIAPLYLQTSIAKTVTLLNVSYDPTRAFYHAYNQAFAQYWKEKTGDHVVVYESHGPSGKQARSVIDGMQGDVVTLALSGDIDALNKYKQLIDPKWQSKLPYHSSPYYSTIVFLVRKGNPKNIHDWGDLIKPGVQILTPNPKTSGVARWNFLAAWAYALEKYGSEAKAYDFVKQLYQHAPILDTGARSSSLSFIQRGLGDVLISWENEAYMALNESKPGEFELITPSVSILAEPPVAVVDSVVDRKGTRVVAEGYLNYLYSDVGQTLAAQYYYRPSNPKIAEEYKDKFHTLKLIPIDKVFKGWKEINNKFFKDNKIFDRIMSEINR